MVPGGVKIPVPFRFAFAHGATVKGIGPAKDWDGKYSDGQARDEETGERLWLVTVEDLDPRAPDHDRRRPGLNHLAFHVDSTQLVDSLTMQAPRYGWTLLFPERHPHAGGDDHYAAYLENVDGFEVELIASNAPNPTQ
jgi:hypothetical protein